MGENNMFAAFIVTGGVFSGSALFYLCLSFATSRLNGKLTPSGVLWLNRVSGCIILGFGVASIASTYG